MRAIVSTPGCWALLAFVCGCGRTSSSSSDAAPIPTVAATEVPASPPPPPMPAIEAGAPTRRLFLPCRAMVVQGSPTLAIDGGAHPLQMGDPASAWITLGASDVVTAKLPRSGRELTVLGPGLADPCSEPDEAWVLRGRFQGSRGSGEAPGAEEWVVTPFAVFRYGAAIVEVTVEDGLARASLKGGSATALPEGATTWQPLDTASPLVVKGAPLGRTGTEASAERCATATAKAKRLEDALLAPGATTTPTFADTAMRATDARVLARAACAIAKLRAPLQPR